MQISSLPYDRYAQERHRRPRGKNSYRISSMLAPYPPIWVQNDLNHDEIEAWGAIELDQNQDDTICIVEEK